MDPATDSSTPDYTLGFSEAAMLAGMRHSARSQAAYLLPHLKPGLRVIDVGCGPGAISLGLAEAVAPGGELYGIDMEESQVELAKRLAQGEGRDNATFQTADAHSLPFEDSFFDVAHFHNVLMHVPDTQRTLQEAKRVLKPGGLVASRELIGASSFLYPDFGVLRQSWDVFEDLVTADDGHPQMGKDLKTHFLEAGFEIVRTSASFDSYSTPEEIAFVYHFANNWFLSPEITDAAVKYGAGTPRLFADIRAAYERWIASPQAWAGLAYGEAVARKL